MTFEITFVLAVAVCAVILFATEKLSVDVVAIVVMVTLMASGIVSPEEGISGFSNKATVTVAAMFILSAGLFKTGAVNYLGTITSRLFKRNFWVGLISVMIAVAFFSAFINNTPVVAIFIPILLGVAKEIKASTSKLLMPMSFASMFGGVCTLIGTSTNILVNSIAERQGQPAFSMFEIAPLGVAMFLIGTTYMLLIGVRLIPERRAEGDLIESFHLHEYITEVVLLEDSSSVGKQIKDAPLVKEIDISIIEIQRGDETIPLPAADVVLKAGDVLRVRCDLEKFKKIQQRQGVVFKPEFQWRDEDIQSFDAKLVEGVIAPHSDFIGKTLKDLNFRGEFGATVLALRHRGVLMREKLSETKLDAGDALLLEVRKRRFNQLRRSPAFVIISEVQQERFRKRKIIPALLIIAGVIITASVGIMDIVASAVIGSVLLVLVGCIKMEEAYKAIEWRIIFLLAGVLALEAAMENSKAGELVSEQIIATVGVWGPIAMISAFYLMTFILTEMMSNTATAALLTPVAIATANTLDLNPRPFLVAVMFAASASFMTPVGYQTNTLIYGPGQYRFADFLKVGTPLNILFWITATILIPYFWPLELMP
ncbi:MAG: SLC13 family permease [Acidobacteriota bacterium]|nr:MAG: SLC13 family permease [Acidobacteriota bacterium]